MSKILSLSMRPRTLSGLFGQEKLAAAVRAHMAKRPPQAWMFHGASGTGKTTIARILAVSYQCSHMKHWGDPCDNCWKSRAEFAIHEINASSVSGIDELEKVVEMSRYRPSNDGGRRVIVLDEAQRISNAAQNMLLKPFEEPPSTTVWIICTTDPTKILLTIRRRLTTYQLKSFSIGTTEKFLEKYAARAGITRPIAPLAEQCHLMGIGAPALLLQALEKYSAGVTPSEAATGTDAANVETLRICKAITAGNWKEVVANLKNATPEDARYIRASVAGWLKGCLARETSPGEQEQAAAGLIELCSPPMDESMMLQWLWGVLNRACRRYMRYTSR